MTRKALVRGGVVILVLAAGAIAAALTGRRLASAGGGVPTARVVRGDVEVTAHTQGELRTTRAMMIPAPRVRGTLQIVTIADTGTAVREGDVIVTFDPAEQQYNLEQSRSELRQAEQELAKMKADVAVQTADDEVALVDARFAVRRAELDVRDNQFISAVDARKNELAVEEARRRLAQLEEDVTSHAATRRASAAVLEERRNKAELAMRQAQADIDQMIVRAPFDGLVSIRENRDAAGGILFSGMVLPEYRAGDLTFTGRSLLDVLDVGRMEVVARVNENDSANLKPGGAARVSVYGFPGLTLDARIKSVAATASSRGIFGSSGAVRQFDAVFELTATDDRLRPGMLAEVVAEGQPLGAVLHLPRQAVFERDGKTVVYAGRPGAFEPVEIKITHRTESWVVIEGVEEGTVVALVDPTAAAAAPAAAAPAPGPTGGGR